MERRTKVAQTLKTMQPVVGERSGIFLRGSRVGDETGTARDITDNDIIAGVASAHSINETVERSLLSRLSSRSRTDSTYSSMSSGRTSPSSSCPVEDLQNRNKVTSSPPAVTFSLLASISPDSSVAKLAIAVESATDLPARDYGAHCDPWVSVTVLKYRRPPAPVAFFRTKTIRHAHNPFYSQTDSHGYPEERNEGNHYKTNILNK